MSKVYIVMAETDIVAVFATEEGAKSFISREFPEPNRLYINDQEVYLM